MKNVRITGCYHKHGRALGFGFHALNCVIYLDIAQNYPFKAHHVAKHLQNLHLATTM